MVHFPHQRDSMEAVYQSNQYKQGRKELTCEDKRTLDILQNMKPAYRKDEILRASMQSAIEHLYITEKIEGYKL